jgi:uncharacterized protein (DUF4415 family)
MKRAITLKPPKSISKRAADPDNPPWREAMLGPAVVRRGRGPQKAPTKVLTTLRLDADVLEYFRSTGPGFQTRINEALRAAKERGEVRVAAGRAGVAQARARYRASRRRQPPSSRSR